MMAKDKDVGFRPFDYYNPELLTNPLFWVNAFRFGVFLYFLPKLNTLPVLTWIGAKFCGNCCAPIVFQSDRKPTHCDMCLQRILW